MTLNITPTAEQDAALDTLRKKRNREQGSSLTTKQFAEILITDLLQSQVAAADSIDRETLREAYQAASPADRATIDALLGRA